MRAGAETNKIPVPEPMRLFEAFRAGDDKSIAKRYGREFDIRQLRALGDITEWKPPA